MSMVLNEDSLNVRLISKSPKHAKCLQERIITGSMFRKTCLNANYMKG